MSKWGIYLNETRYCPSERGTGNRPCDTGAICDQCMQDLALVEKFHKEFEYTVQEELYCKCCNHKLRLHELLKGYCDECVEYREE